jgi:hypothetical protein
MKWKENTAKVLPTRPSLAITSSESERMEAVPCMANEVHRFMMKQNQHASAASWPSHLAVVDYCTVAAALLHSASVQTQSISYWTPLRQERNADGQQQQQQQ